jgi:NAD(P)-dependent dehydrogenase (short-subunit alcohol dehydrogenase family)
MTPPSAVPVAGTSTWFITGIGGGLGHRMATHLLSRGDRVAGTTRDPGSVADLRARHGDRLWTTRLDVTAVGSVKSVVDQAFADLGRIDVIVNNAGYGLFGAAEEFTDAQIAHHLATNLTGSIAVTRAALPHLRAQGHGRIVQISSYGGQAANAGASLYNAGKFGIEGFMEALAAELVPFGVGVTIVEPGGTATGFRRNAVLGAPLRAYDGTPASFVRALRDAPRPSPGDPAKVAALTIAAAERQPAPLRVVLGSDSHQYVHDALVQRLAGIDGQRSAAAAADADPPGPRRV